MKLEDMKGLPPSEPTFLPGSFIADGKIVVVTGDGAVIETAVPA